MTGVRDENALTPDSDVVRVGNRRVSSKLLLSEGQAAVRN
jgi:hypothetical protein